MKKVILAAVLAAMVHANPAWAQAFLTGSGTANASDPTTNLRLARNGISSTWASPKTFPGTATNNNTYFDTVNATFSANSSQTVYYRISYSGVSGAPFGSAYLNSFSPSSLATNYLGDSGTSPSIGASVSFQVIVPQGNTLQLVFNSATVSTPASYTYSVEAFSDAMGGMNFGAPEPAAWALMILGFGAVGSVLRRRRSVHRVAPLAA